MLDFILEEKPNHPVASYDVGIVSNSEETSAKMEQRENVLAKCLQFLRLMTR